VHVDARRAQILSDESFLLKARIPNFRSPAQYIERSLKLKGWTVVFGCNASATEEVAS